MRAIVKAAENIDELAYTLENVCADTHRSIHDLPDSELVSEAEYVLSCFFEGGHINNEALVGEADGPFDQKWARGEVRKLKAFIKKYKV